MNFATIWEDQSGKVYSNEPDSIRLGKSFISFDEADALNICSFFPNPRRKINQSLFYYFSVTWLYYLWRWHDVSLLDRLNIDLVFLETFWNADLFELLAILLFEYFFMLGETSSKNSKYLIRVVLGKKSFWKSCFVMKLRCTCV